MSPKIVDKNIRKKIISNSAMELFANNGIQNTTINQIADHCGMGKGTLYEYYKSKDDILLDIFNIIVDDAERYIIDELDSANSYTETLKALLIGYIKFINSLPKNSVIVIFAFQIETFLKKDSPHLKDILQKKEEKRKSYEQYIIEALEMMKDSGEFVNFDTTEFIKVYYNYISGLAMNLLFMPEDDHIKNIDFFIDSLINGIKKHRGE